MYLSVCAPVNVHHSIHPSKAFKFSPLGLGEVGGLPGAFEIAAELPEA